MIHIKDFKVGQTVWLELTGNASRYKQENSEECIQEGIVEAVGRKYVVVNGIQFEEHNLPAYQNALKEHTQYCTDYLLYSDKQIILDKFEKEKLLYSLRNTFLYSNSSRCKKLSLEKLREIQSIIEEDEYVIENEDDLER